MLSTVSQLGPPVKARVCLHSCFLVDARRGIDLQDLGLALPTGGKRVLDGRSVLRRQTADPSQALREVLRQDLLSGLCSN